jgi:Undecaprenyl-phosphate galactose phosphotransferase WbaP
MALSDAAALALAGYLAWLFWAHPFHRQPWGLYAGLWPLILLFELGYAQAGLYPATGLGPVETMRRLTYVTSITFVVIAAMSFGMKLPYVYSRATFLIALVLAVVLVPIVRLSVLAIVSRSAWWPQAVVLAADDLSRVRRALDELGWNRSLGYRPLAVLWLGHGEAPAAVGLPPIFGRESVGELARAAELVLLTATGPNSTVSFDELHRRFRRVLMIRELDQLPVEGIRIRNLGSLLGIEYTNNLLDARNRALKRTLDLVLGGGAFLLSLPLVALCMLAVKLRSPGPALFVQPRAGASGRRIGVPKIRTMVPGAEQKLEEAMAADPEIRREWEETMKLKSDPRLIPGLGRLLRRWSLDELPQLWSVVKGEMSLVGPRPFPDYHLAQFSERFRELRSRVRPGITGLWQVKVRSSGPLEEQESLDTYYIRNWSFWLDCYILARTVTAVLGGRGAF